MRFITYISSFFVIILAFITVIYNVNSQNTLFKPAKMYPYFSEIKYKIDKIEIRYPNHTISLTQEKNKWYVENADRFPANRVIIDKIYQAIDGLTLINNKTNIIDDFYKIGLLNPNNKEIIKGEGIRITLLADKNKPYIDFIIGDTLKSYQNQNNKRLFTRYSTNGGAYLANSLTDFRFEFSDFLTDDFGMPSASEVIEATLTIKDRDVLNIKRVIDKSNPKELVFMPPAIPQDKKLVYPDVMRDYMIAFTGKLKPIGAIYLPIENSMTDVFMVFRLTQGRSVQFNFWQTNKRHYMRIIRSDKITPHKEYVYQIKNSDYISLIQPINKFLIDYSH